MGKCQGCGQPTTEPVKVEGHTFHVCRECGDVLRYNEDMLKREVQMDKFLRYLKEVAV